MLFGRGPPITPSTVIGCSGSCGASCWGSVAAVAAVLVVDGAAVVVVVAGRVAVATTLVPAECLACRRYELSVCRAVHTASAARTASAAAAASTVAVHLQQHLGNHAVLGVCRRRSPLLAQVPPAMLPVFSSPLQLKCLQPGCSRLNQKKAEWRGATYTRCRRLRYLLLACVIHGVGSLPLPGASAVCKPCPSNRQTACAPRGMFLCACSGCDTVCHQAPVPVSQHDAPCRCVGTGAAAASTGTSVAGRGCCGKWQPYSTAGQLGASTPQSLMPTSLASNLSKYAGVRCMGVCTTLLGGCERHPCPCNQDTPKAGAFCAPRCCRCWWRV